MLRGERLVSIYTVFQSALARALGTTETCCMTQNPHEVDIRAQQLQEQETFGVVNRRRWGRQTTCQIMNE